MRIISRILLYTTLATTGWMISPTGWGAESNVTGNTKLEVNISGMLKQRGQLSNLIPVDNISIDHLYKQIPMFVKPTLSPEQQKRVVASDAARMAQKAVIESEKAYKASKRAAKAATKCDLIESKKAVKAAQTAANSAKSAANAITECVPKKKIVKAQEIVLNANPKTSLIEAKIDLVEVSKIKIPNPEQVWVYKKKESDRKIKYIEISIITGKTKKTKTKTNYLIEKRKKIYCDRITPAGPEELEVPLEALKSLQIEGYTRREDEKRKRKEYDEKKVIEKLIKQEEKTKS